MWLYLERILEESLHQAERGELTWGQPEDAPGTMNTAFVLLKHTNSYMPLFCFLTQNCLLSHVIVPMAQISTCHESQQVSQSDNHHGDGETINYAPDSHWDTSFENATDSFNNQSCGVLIRTTTLVRWRYHRAGLHHTNSRSADVDESHSDFVKAYSNVIQQDML